MPPRTPSLSAANIKPTSLPINELLSSRYPAHVPRYQRAYAWDDDQVSDLIHDVEALLSEKPGTRGHFYGAMVAITKHDSAEPGSTVYEIVDGQQRLATFCLLLARIADRAQDIRTKALSAHKTAEAKKLLVLSERIRNSCLYYERYDVNNGIKSIEPRIRLSRVDDQFFQDLLADKSPVAIRESHRLLTAAFSVLSDELVEKHTSDIDIGTNRKSLQRLADAVLQDSFVIHIVSDTRSSGYRLFAVLNDRGARLTVGDLLRNHTLELLDGKASDFERAAELWDDVLATGAEAIDNFLITYYTSLTGKRTKRASMFDDLVKLLFPPGESAAGVLSRIANLKTELEMFNAIEKGKWPYDAPDQSSKVKDWQRSRLQRLVATLRHELAMPLLLAARARGGEEVFAHLTHMVELFAFRYKNVCGAHATPASTAYYAECLRIRQHGLSSIGDLSTLRAALKKLIDSRASDTIFTNSIRDQLTYDAGSAARSNIRHLLCTLEEYGEWLRKGATGTPVPSTTAVTDIAQATLEHIYPQHAPHRDPDLEKVVHRLGNLSYWGPGDNQAAANDPFSAKRTAYRASMIGLNQALASLATWDLKAFNERETELIKDACKVFVI
jgi:hypothetical protein